MDNGLQPSFYRLWQEERVLEILFELLGKEDICSVRLANSACCNLVTKRLFLRTHLTFTANSFTKAHRVQALARIGHHIQHLTFNFPHSESTFLPPLIHPQSGHEISFLYTPYTHMTSSLTRPKYANTELGDILTQQYPPLFHAATNVPSFINAAKHLPNMRHLTIKCPGQDPRERYRRDIVDYALLSLRIALERAPLPKLHKLTLAAVHPSAFNYLRHVPGFGCLPSAGRRWRQIRKLSIAVESWDFYGPSPGRDHLKIMEDYIRHFSPTLEKLTFTWLGRKGPCPLALSGDPLFSPPRSSRKLFNEVTSPMSPLPPAPLGRPVVFPRLRYLTVRNATMNVPQVSQLVRIHQGSVREFDFENVVLINGGSWDDALAPLTDQSSDRGSDVWSRHSMISTRGNPENEITNAKPTATPMASPRQRVEEAVLPSPSAAVAAASRELLELDVEGLESFLGLNGPEEPRTPQQQNRPTSITLFGLADLPPPREADEDKQQEDDDLASDIAAAKEASLLSSTNLKKRVRRHRKHDTREDDDTETEDRNRRRHRRHRDRSRDSSRHRHDKSRHEPRSQSSSSSSRRRHHRRPHRHERPETPPPLPEVVLAEGDEVRRGSPKQRSPPPNNASSLTISAPVLSREPMPAMLMLKPAVYDPSATPSPPRPNPPQFHSESSATLVYQPSTSSLHDQSSSSPKSRRQRESNIHDQDDVFLLSPVQRNIEQEEAHRRLAEDAAARSSALQNAKATVLAKLTRELSKMKTREGPGPSSSSSGVFGMRCAAEVAAASCAAAAASGVGRGNGGGSSGLMGFRLREGLFGSKSSASLAPSHQSLDSTSTLVPLIFSR